MAIFEKTVGQIRPNFCVLNSGDQYALFDAQQSYELYLRIKELIFRLKMAIKWSFLAIFEKTVGRIHPNFCVLNSGDQYASFGTPQSYTIS